MEKHVFLKILKESFFVFLIFGASTLLCYLLPYEKEYGYSQMLESCGKSEWLHHRIFNSNTPIDIALIGSSQTLCGIQDSILEYNLSKNNNQLLRVANLGFCRYGRSLHYGIIKDLFKNHSPSILVIEVREKESRFNHHDFQHIADREDILDFNFHNTYFKQILEGAKNRFDFIFKQTTEGNLISNSTDEYSDYFYFTKKIVADSTILNKRKKENSNKTKSNNKFNWQYFMSKNYLQKIKTLADQHKSQLYFLYLPSYGSSITTPKETSFYRKIGHLLIPPKSIMENPTNWVDHNHLNYNGSVILTDWLSENIKR